MQILYQLGMRYWLSKQIVNWYLEKLKIYLVSTCKVFSIFYYVLQFSFCCLNNVLLTYHPEDSDAAIFHM